MSQTSLLVESRNRAFKRVVADVQGVKDDQGHQLYVVNDEAESLRSGKRNFVASQSNIVSILPISSATTNYVFNVKDGLANSGNANILPMESRLKDQDVFYTAGIGFFLTCYNFFGYTPIQFQYWTYPSPALFNPAGLSDIGSLNGIWQLGYLEYKVNGIVQIPKWWMGRHEFVPQTETGFGGVPVNPLWDQQDYSGDGYLVTEPNWILNGGNNNLFSLTYGNTWGQVNLAPGVANLQMGLIMVWDGWLVQNASSIMYNKPGK